VPGYFYRQKEDGSFSNASGCGNEVASEREMVRKYIIDTLNYWVEEFHVDGFRFDLMGIHDLKTMQEIRKSLDKIDRGLFLYGEGWAADQSPMPESKRAVKKNTSAMRRIASFNDDFRDALKGNHGDKKSKGFVSGLNLREEAIKFGITAAVYHPQVNYGFIDTVETAWAAEPDQCINYVSCHDNYTLWDKLKQSLPKASDEELRKRSKLAGALVLTSQGVPLLHAGVDFCRTKGGNGNSYKSPDSVNQIDWSRKNEYLDVFEYFQKLIQLRKNHPAFRMTSADAIRRDLNFCAEYKIGVVSYCLDGKAAGDNWSKIFLIFNGNEEPVEFPLPEGRYKVVADANSINEEGIKVVEDTVVVEPVSLKILVHAENG
jgi:pullulanase